MTTPETAAPIMGQSGKHIKPDSLRKALYRQRIRDEARGKAHADANRAAGIKPEPAPLPPGVEEAFRAAGLETVGILHIETVPEALPPAADDDSSPRPLTESVNERREIERVWWARVMPGNHNWTEDTPARAIRRTDAKTFIVYLEKFRGPGIDRALPESWIPKTTWVKKENIKPREAAEDHVTRAAYPDF